ncbi:MAG: nickel pincer cofactor biosynthesis protein LarB [Desulfovibrionaceae bacterium]|nr:nickel pincer cofactor biosynthesis protein LarB [Desulfovibrionaceae bacterium]
MTKEILQDILARLARGQLGESEALAEALQRLGGQAASDALQGLCLDTGRVLRTGLGEVVFAQGTSRAALLAAVEGLAAHGPVLVSRVSPGQGKALQEAFGQGNSHEEYQGHYWPEARLFALGTPEGFRQKCLPPWPQQGEVLVVSAGAADMPVALEAYGALCFWGVDCGFIGDVGIAGLHRLAAHIPALRSARVIIAVAGMEGALPGVLAGLTPAPVLAVPTSVGYGIGTGGVAALSTMLCTCVPGVAVLNIDNGFGAAAFAAKLTLGRPERR